MASKKTLLITGATGFLGSHVCAEMLRGGWEVRGLARPGQAVPAGVTSFEGDLGDDNALRAATAGVEAVIHLAARVHVMKERERDPLPVYRRVNVDGTLRLFRNAARNGVQHFVFASSVKAAAESSGKPLTEDMKPQPVDPYGVSKLEAENVLSEQASDVSVSILRFPLIYGAGMRGNMLRLFRLVSRGVPLPFGGLHNKRSVLYAGNASAAIRTVIETGAPAAQIFFVADAYAPSMRELVRYIGDALGVRASMIWLPRDLFRVAATFSETAANVLPVAPIAMALRRFSDPLVVSTEKLQRLTGFTAPYSLQAGLSQTARWYRAR
jgi:nucleoside-diphosphate-sugar epimerase